MSVNLESVLFIYLKKGDCIMNDILKAFLFNKHILVNDEGVKRGVCFHVIFALANKFDIRVTAGMDLATPDMIRFAANQLGEYVPEPFYRGFPESVKALSADEKLFDQLLSYALTYGLNNFTEARHSVFEEPFERIAFHENTTPKDFVILEEVQADKELYGFIHSMLSSTRPLSDDQLTVVYSYLEENKKPIQMCASKKTAIDLLLHFRDPYYARFIELPDVIKLVETMNFNENDETNIRKLNLSNQQRKLVTKVIDRCLDNAYDFDKNLRDCFEKRQVWKGLLHHIHYQAKNENGRVFVDAIRNNKENLSAYAAFEKALRIYGPVDAARELQRLKGTGAVARNLNYILSRCQTQDEVKQVLQSMGTINPILSLQMLLQYKAYTAENRVFKFIRFNRLTKHTETDEELGHRKSVLPKETCRVVTEFMEASLKEVLGRRKVGKVFIDEKMKKIALPLQEAASSSGFGVLPRGTRLPMPEETKIRVFTYWEKVDDIDLSAFAVDPDGSFFELSWRTMWGDPSNQTAIFSGDETSGYDGGSEYFDVDLEKFHDEFPDTRYLVFANNVYSNIEFNKCFCKAGYMIREKEDSGEIFEPKTVASSYVINANTTYALLFALDLEKKEVVWLNFGMANEYTIAGMDDISFVLPYMNITDVANVYSMFQTKASELVEKPEDADIIVSDETFESIRDDQQQIHSYDYEKLLGYMNQM